MISEWSVWLEECHISSVHLSDITSRIDHIHLFTFSAQDKFRFEERRESQLHIGGGAFSWQLKEFVHFLHHNSQVETFCSLHKCDTECKPKSEDSRSNTFSFQIKNQISTECYMGVYTIGKNWNVKHYHVRTCSYTAATAIFLYIGRRLQYISEEITL